MNIDKIIRYDDIEHVIVAYIKDLYVFRRRGAETAALYFTLNSLSRVPESGCVIEYEQRVIRDLERLLIDYQGGQGDYGHGQGAIRVALARVRALFFDAKAYSQNNFCIDRWTVPFELPCIDYVPTVLTSEVAFVPLGHQV